MIRNACQCLKCGDVIESKHVHDWVSCKCGNIFTDGGMSYMRRGASDMSLIKDLSEMDELAYSLTFCRAKTQIAAQIANESKYIDYHDDYEQWRCKTCGCLWRRFRPWGIFPLGSWSPDRDSKAGTACCDNVPMTNLEFIKNVLSNIPGHDGEIKTRFIQPEEI